MVHLLLWKWERIQKTFLSSVKRTCFHCDWLHPNKANFIWQEWDSVSGEQCQTGQDVMTTWGVCHGNSLVGWTQPRKLLKNKRKEERETLVARERLEHRQWSSLLSRTVFHLSKCLRGILWDRQYIFVLLCWAQYLSPGVCYDKWDTTNVMLCFGMLQIRLRRRVGSTPWDILISF